MKRTAIYCRISRDTAGLGLGVERQESECRALARKLRWKVAAVFVDNDVSAYRGKPRPGYVALVDAMRAGEVDALIAWHPDRLTRSVRELEDLIDVLEATSTDVATVAGGTYDLSTPAGRMTARVIGSTARYESEQKSERQRSKARQLAESGKLHGGGTRPFGYEADRLTIVEPEAAVLREAADLVCSGWSLRRVVRHVTECGHRTPTGVAWAPTSLRRMLISPRVAGLREHRGEVVGAAEWPAIVDRETWERCRLTLTDPARRQNERMTRYLLVGLAHTSTGIRMFARPNSRGVRRYFALPVDGKQGGAIQADELEAAVVDAVLRRFDKTTIPTPKSTKANDGLADVEAIEAEMDELAKLRGDGVISMREWVAAREPLQARLDAARASATPNAAPSALANLLGKKGALRTAWDDLTFDQRQDVLRIIIERVVIAPAVRGRNKYDPDRVTIEYRA